MVRQDHHGQADLHTDRVGIAIRCAKDVVSHTVFLKELLIIRILQSERRATPARRAWDGVCLA